MLKGLVSLVTGGASGLGRGTVEYLARHGGSVISVDLPQSDGQKVANDAIGNVVFVPCDVADEADVINAVNTCKEKFGRLDLAVSCAGIHRAFKVANPYRKNVFNSEDWNIVYNSHVTGTFNIARFAAQLMAEKEVQEENQQRGLIINTSGTSSEDGCIGQSAIGAAKGAISAMTLPLARDLASLGIRVVAISPGLFDTPLTSEECLTAPVHDYYRQQIIFPKRFGDPLEYANMVHEILENQFINGEVIKLSGGLRYHCHTRVPTEENVRKVIEKRTEKDGTTNRADGAILDSTISRAESQRLEAGRKFDS